MIVHEKRERPASWQVLRSQIHHVWIVPFIAFEWAWQWAAYLLSRWSFLEVLEYLGSFSVLVAVIFYFAATGDRVKQRHYQAWQVINTAQGKGGSGGRIDALQSLNADHVPLVGVDVSSAFLQGLKLEHANLLRANFAAADVRNSDLCFVDFVDANLHSANFRGSSLRNSSFLRADLGDSDLNGTDLTGSSLDGADLSDADLRHANLQGVQWKQIKSIKAANIADVTNAPSGFVEWAMKNGAVQASSADE